MAMGWAPHSLEGFHIHLLSEGCALELCNSLALGGTGLLVRGTRVTH